MKKADILIALFLIVLVIGAVALGFSINNTHEVDKLKKMEEQKSAGDVIFCSVKFKSPVEIDLNADEEPVHIISDFDDIPHWDHDSSSPELFLDNIDGSIFGQRGILHTTENGRGFFSKKAVSLFLSFTLVTEMDAMYDNEVGINIGLLQNKKFVNSNKTYVLTDLTNIAITSRSLTIEIEKDKPYYFGLSAINQDVTMKLLTFDYYITVV